MPQAQTIRAEENMESLFYALFHSVQYAALTEGELVRFVSEHPNAKKNQKILDKMATLASVSLPNAFGKLIASSDLQNAFLSLGRYVRSFEDAVYVLGKLQSVLIDRLANTTEAVDINTAVTELMKWSGQYKDLFALLKN